MDLSIFGRRILSPPRPPPGPSIEMVSSPGVAERERPPAADDASPAAPDLRGDWPNFFLLILLYVMQGIPLGLSSAVPILLQGNKNVSYSDQALLSVIGWPFSMKILWAPLVDSLYVQKFGRRKSWLVPIQLSIGACFFYLSENVDELLPAVGRPDVVKIVWVFFISTLLAATQDIVVDGWALTVLKKRNVGYASTCNLTGQVVGVMIGTVFSVLFTSEDFCNRYLRLSPGAGGIMTMKSLFYVWGVSFVVITLAIAAIKKEDDHRLEDNHVKLNTFQNYALLWDIVRLPSVQILALTLVTMEIGFAASDSMFVLKLIDAGVPRDDLMVINTAMFAVRAFVPLLVGKYTSGPKPMGVFLNTMPVRILWNIAYFGLAYYTPKLIKNKGVVVIPTYYYTILVIIVSIHDIIYNIMIAAMLALFSRISDSRFGGTYMTLLNALLNLGKAWTQTLSIGLVDYSTIGKCSNDLTRGCSSIDSQNTCLTNGGDCVEIHGFFVETIICSILGIIWLGIFNNIVRDLQTRSLSCWLVNVKKPIKENDKNVFTLSVK